MSQVLVVAVVVVVVVVVFDLLSFIFNGARVQIPAQPRNSLPQIVHTKSEAHPTTHSTGIGFLPLGIKQPGREANYSPPSSAKVRNEWSYTSAPPVCLPGEGTDSSVFLVNGLANDK